MTNHSNISEDGDTCLEHHTVQKGHANCRCTIRAHYVQIDRQFDKLKSGKSYGAQSHSQDLMQLSPLYHDHRAVILDSRANTAHGRNVEGDGLTAAFKQQPPGLAVIRQQTALQPPENRASETVTSILDGELFMYECGDTIALLDSEPPTASLPVFFSTLQSVTQYPRNASQPPPPPMHLFCKRVQPLRVVSLPPPKLRTWADVVKSYCPLTISASSSARSAQPIAPLPLPSQPAGRLCGSGLAISRRHRKLGGRRY